MELTLKLKDEDKKEKETRDAFNKLLSVVNQVENSYFFVLIFQRMSWRGIFIIIIIFERMNENFFLCRSILPETESFNL